MHTILAGGSQSGLDKLKRKEGRLKVGEICMGKARVS
jgi:hypothetical protein